MLLFGTDAQVCLLDDSLSYSSPSSSSRRTSCKLAGSGPRKGRRAPREKLWQRQKRKTRPRTRQGRMAKVAKPTLVTKPSRVLGMRKLAWWRRTGGNWSRKCGRSFNRATPRRRSRATCTCRSEGPLSGQSAARRQGDQLLGRHGGLERARDRRGQVSDAGLQPVRTDFVPSFN